MDKQRNKKPAVLISRQDVEQSEKSAPALPSGKLVRRTMLRAGRKDLANIKFDTSSPLVRQSWHSDSKHVLCLNAYPNGITVSQHECSEDSKFILESFQLRLRDTREFRLPKGKYYLYRDAVRTALEKHLSALHKSGVLARTTIYFGTVTDPFLSFRKKFDVTMACLEVIEKFKPGRLVIQTRSPMVISALPALKELAERSVVSIPVETILEDSVSSYTPGLPAISERFVAASGLRRQGVTVNLQVAPALPYGDFYKDAWKFAELLESYGDYITFGSLALGRKEEERQLKQFAICQKLAADKRYHFLRPYSYRNIFKALQEIAPEKLELPVREDGSKSKQLNLFAA